MPALALGRCVVVATARSFVVPCRLVAGMRDLHILQPAGVSIAVQFNNPRQQQQGFRVGLGAPRMRWCTDKATDKMIDVEGGKIGEQKPEEVCLRALLTAQA